MADLLPDAADEGLQRAGLTQFSSESWSVHYAGAHDLQLFFQTVIPKATEIIRPVVTKYGYPATQDGEALALCMSPRVLICSSAASLVPPWCTRGPLLRILTDSPMLPARCLLQVPHNLHQP